MSRSTCMANTRVKKVRFNAEVVLRNGAAHTATNDAFQITQEGGLLHLVDRVTNTHVVVPMNNVRYFEFLPGADTEEAPSKGAKK
jgi:hypothetical protein